MSTETTATFTVSRQYYFREIHRSVPAGATVELPQQVADRYMADHPGLLAPVRRTTQGAPESVRSTKNTRKSARSKKGDDKAPKADAKGKNAPPPQPAAEPKTAK